MNYDPFDVQVGVFKEVIRKALKRKEGTSIAALALSRKYRDHKALLADLRKASREAVPRGDLSTASNDALGSVGLSREDIIGNPYRFSMMLDRVTTYSYVLAALIELYEELTMDCMACKAAMTPETTRFWRKVLVCKSCGEIADKAESELVRQHALALEHSLNWLEQRVLAGELNGLPVLHAVEVPEVRSEE